MLTKKPQNHLGLDINVTRKKTEQPQDTGRVMWVDMLSHLESYLRTNGSNKIKYFFFKKM